MNAYCYRFISGYASAKFTPKYIRHGGQYKSHWRPAATLVSMGVVYCLQCGSNAPLGRALILRPSLRFYSNSSYLFR